MFSTVISEHFSKNCVVISVVAAKIWYLKKMCGFYWATLYCRQLTFVSAPRYSVPYNVHKVLL